VDLCGFDRRTGWCRGCGRTREEARGWKKAQPHPLGRITADLPQRLARLKAKTS
jgi:predicted Fe-S protein YdhL (DUF1289 family)